MAAAARAVRLPRLRVRAHGDGGGAPAPQQGPPRPVSTAPRAAPRAPPAAKPAKRRRQHSEVGVFWDLDNKGPAPGAPPRAVARALRELAQEYGNVRAFDAFANRHAFSWTTPWLAEQARADVAEQAAQAGLVCELCGGRFKSLERLRKHFMELHQREADKRARGRNHSRKMPAKEAAKVQRVREAREAIFMPPTGNRVSYTLRDEGVRVVQVGDEAEAADKALAAAMNAFLNARLPLQSDAALPKPAPTVVLVSGDRGFDEQLSVMAQRGVRCVLVADARRSALPGVDLLAWGHVLRLAAEMHAAEEDEEYIDDEEWDTELY